MCLMHEKGENRFLHHKVWRETFLYICTKRNEKEKQHVIVEVEQIKLTYDVSLVWKFSWQAKIMTSASLCYGFHVGKQKRLKGTLKRIKIIFVENLSFSFCSELRSILSLGTMTLFWALVEWDFNVQLLCGCKLLKLLYVSVFKHQSSSLFVLRWKLLNILKTLLIAFCVIRRREKQELKAGMDV